MAGRKKTIAETGLGAIIKAKPEVMDELLSDLDPDNVAREIAGEIEFTPDHSAPQKEARLSQILNRDLMLKERREQLEHWKTKAKYYNGLLRDGRKMEAALEKRVKRTAKRLEFYKERLEGNRKTQENRKKKLEMIEKRRTDTRKSIHSRRMALYQNAKQIILREFYRKMGLPLPIGLRRTISILQLSEEDKKLEFLKEKPSAIPQAEDNDDDDNNQMEDDTNDDSDTEPEDDEDDFDNEEEE